MKYFTKNNLIYLLLAIILIMGISLFTCNKVIEKPVIVSVPEVIERVVKDSLRTKQILDSTSAINKIYIKRADSLERDLHSTEDLVTELLNEAIIPQTSDSTAYYDWIAKTIEAHNREVELCDSTISLYRLQTENLEYQLTAKDTLYSRIRENLNTLSNNQLSLEGYNKTLEKQLKKSKKGNKFWKITSGALAAGLIGSILTK
jgi:hypothetical protein